MEEAELQRRAQARAELASAREMQALERKREAERLAASADSAAQKQEQIRAAATYDRAARLHHEAAEHQRKHCRAHDHTA